MDEITHLQMENMQYVRLPKKTKDVSDAAAGTTFLIERHLAEFEKMETGRSERTRHRAHTPGRRIARYRLQKNRV